MIEFPANQFFEIAAVLKRLRNAVAPSKSGDAMTSEIKEVTADTLELVKVLCDAVGLDLSSQYATRMLEDPKDKRSATAGQLDILEERIVDQLMSVRLLCIPGHQANFWNDAPKFGAGVAEKFPKLIYDIEESARCFATNRTTACVFHLMRVMEAAVQFLGNRLGISLVNEKNWHNILDEVDKAIKSLPVSTSKQKTKRNKLAEASAHLRMVKDAWRNEVMHPKETYTEEEAERVFRNVKDFMVHLATKL